MDQHQNTTAASAAFSDAKKRVVRSLTEQIEIYRLRQKNIPASRYIPLRSRDTHAVYQTEKVYEILDKITQKRFLGKKIFSEAMSWCNILNEHPKAAARLVHVFGGWNTNNTRIRFPNKFSDTATINEAMWIKELYAFEEATKEWRRQHLPDWTLIEEEIDHRMIPF